MSEPAESGRTDAAEAARAPGPVAPAARPGASAAKLARVALAWTVGIALLLWLARDVEWHRLAASVRTAPAWAWVTTVLGLLVSYLLRALRIRAELRARHPLTVAQCLGVMLIHNSAVNVLPMRGGEAAYPWLMHRRLGVPLDHATASLVWMRLQDAFVLALLVVAFWPGPVSLRLAAAGALVLALAVGLRVLDRLAAATPRGPRLVHVAHRAVRALALAPRHGWTGWCCSVGSWSVKLVALGGLLGALSGLSPVAAVSGALGGELSGVLPVQGPANAGTYEAGVYMGAALRAASPVDVVPAAIAVHVLSLATALVSGAVAWALSHRRRAEPSTPRNWP